MEYWSSGQAGASFGMVVRLDPGDEIITCLTALQEREHLGFAQVSGLAAVGEAEIGVFDTVKKQFRGGGTGHLLLETYIGVARALGCRKCGLLVSSFNPRAKALYQSLGFQKVGYITDFLPGAHENIMVKNL